MKVDHTQQRALPVARYSSLVTHVLAYAAILVAFFLRAYRLADKNVWWDEGWSIWLSQQDLAWIALRTAADEHPPLHYWMLHFWNALAGTNAFAGRFLSVAFGVLTIALIYRMGKRIGGMWLGILAALFLATARFHVWWSQDIKNYTPSIFFAFAAVWFALTILEKPNSKAILGYALSAALAALTHYLAALIVLALNLYALIVFIRQFQVSNESFRQLSSTLHPWIIANALALLLFSPWFVLYLQNAQAWSAAPAFDFGLFLKLVATVLPLGVTTNIENYAGLTIALTTLAALGCVGIFGNSEFGIQNSRQEFRIPNSEFRILLFALIVLLPPILIYLLSLTPVSFFAPKIQARYLVILVPAYALLLTLGIATLRKFSIYLALAATLLVLAANAFVLNDYYAERRLRDEYATLVNTIDSFARQGDLILLDTDQEWPTFLYYLRAPLDWLGVPNGAEMTEADADAIVKRALTRHNAVWLVTIPDGYEKDPQHLLKPRLSRDLPMQFEETFDDKRLELYAPLPRNILNVASENFYPQVRRVEKISDDLQLLGYDLPVREVRAGDAVHLVTYWNAQKPSDIGIGWSYPGLPTTHIWRGERVRIENVILIPNAPSELPIVAGTLELARLHIEPRGLPKTGIAANRVDYRFGDAIRLIGYDLPQTTFHADEQVQLVIFWFTDRAISKNYVVFVHLLGSEWNPAQNNLLWGQVDRIPIYRMTAWLPNDIISDGYLVPIAKNAPAGKYKIEVGMYDAVTGTRLKLNDGSDSVILAEIEIVR